MKKNCALKGAAKNMYVARLIRVQLEQNSPAAYELPARSEGTMHFPGGKITKHRVCTFAHVAMFQV